MNPRNAERILKGADRLGMEPGDGHWETAMTLSGMTYEDIQAGFRREERRLRLRGLMLDVAWFVGVALIVGSLIGAFA